jgi:hypothetical protein
MCTTMVHHMRRLAPLDFEPVPVGIKRTHQALMGS